MRSIQKKRLQNGILCLNMMVIAFFSCVNKSTQPPTGSINLAPARGDSLTVFKMDANSFIDDITPAWQLKVRWDVNSDGIWETSFSIFKEFVYRFPAEGSYRVTCECLDTDGNIGKDIKTILVGAIFKDSVLIDFRDHKTYKVVLLNDRWWMAQGLRTGQEISRDSNPSDNGLDEFVMHPKDVDSTFGGFYTWDEATRYGQDTVRGICPNGWRLPRKEDISELQKLVWFRQDLGQYLGPAGYFGLNLPLTGRFIGSQRIFYMRGVQGEFWINDGSRPIQFRSWANYDGQYYPRIFYEGYFQTPGWVGWDNDWGTFQYKEVAIPIRCIKNE